MSDHSHHSEPKADFFSPQKANTLAVVSGVAGLVGVALSLLFGLGDARQFAFSWLFAFMFFFTIAVGSLFWVLVHHATDAEWSVVVRRQLEHLGALLPVLFVLFFSGIIFFAPYLLRWWNLTPEQDHGLAAKAGYLNHTAFYLRALIYFILLGGVGLLVRRNSVNQDADGNPVYTVRNRVLSFAGIPILALSLTFASVDWLMGLDHHWFSTMWGVYIFGGSAAAAMSVLVLIVTALKRQGHLQVVTMEHYHIMGKLLLAFCIFWAYIGFSQYMLIWYASIPEETSFFIRRNAESWWYLSLILVIGRFFIPLPFLLFQGTKKNAKVICALAAWLLLMQALDLYIIVLPMLHPDGFSLNPLDFTALLGVGGICAAFFFLKLSKSSLFPVRDPRIPESLRLSN